MPRHRRRRSSSASVIAVEYLIDELARADILAIKAQRQRPERQEKRLRSALRPCGDDAVVHQRDDASRNDDTATVSLMLLKTRECLLCEVCLCSDQVLVVDPERAGRDPAALEFLLLPLRGRQHVRKYVRHWNLLAFPEEMK